MVRVTRGLLWVCRDYFRRSDCEVTTTVRPSQGNLNAAKSLYERSLSIEVRSLGPNHQDVALSLNNMALLLEEQVGQPSLLGNSVLGL